MADLTFEKALKKLEQIVSDLESGDFSLEKSISKFEEGIKLSKYCSLKLTETEKKITMLLNDHNNDIVEKPFVNTKDG